MPIASGINTDVDAGTETIFPGGGLWLPPTAARVHAIVSTSTDDDGSPAGTGARTVRVTGFTAAGVTSSETVTMDGTTPVNTSGSYLHITEIQVLTVGSGGTNAGIITATAASDSTISAAMSVGTALSSGCFLYVQTVGEQLALRSVTISSDISGGATVSHDVWLQVKPLAAIPTRIPLGCLYSGASSILTVPLDVVIGYGEWARIDVTSSAANTSVTGLIHYVKVA